MSRKCRCLSVHLSVPSIDSSNGAAGGFAAERLRAGEIDRQLRAPCSRCRRSAANVDSTTLTTDGEAEHRLVYDQCQSFINSFHSYE